MSPGGVTPRTIRTTPRAVTSCAVRSRCPNVGVASRATAIRSDVAYRKSALLVRASSDKRPSEAASREADETIAKMEEAMSEANDAGAEAAEDVSKGVKRGGVVYGALAAIYAALAVGKVAAPGFVIESVYSACGRESALAFMRLSGLFMVLPAVALWCLKGAAEHGRLSSSTYDRLNSSLMIAGLGCAGLAANEALNSNFMLATTNAIWGVVAIGVITAAAAGHVLARGAGVGTVLARIPSEASQLLKPANKMSAFYALLTAVCALMGAALLVAPTSLHNLLFAESSAIGALNIALKRNIGVMILTMAVATTYTLKDAADRSRLGASTFKTLNLGFSVVCAGTLGTLAYYAQTFPEAQLTTASISMLAVLAVATATCGYQWATASK